MLLVSFTFLGADVKVEVCGPYSGDNKIDDNEYLKGLIGSAPSIIKKDGDKFRAVYSWCETNSDFKDTTRSRQSNFVFDRRADHAENQNKIDEGNRAGTIGGI